MAHLNIGVFRDNAPRPSTPVTCDKDAGNRRKEPGGDSRVSKEHGFINGKIHQYFWLVVSNICYFRPYLGKRSNLTNVFEMAWNHQPDLLEDKIIFIHGLVFQCHVRFSGKIHPGTFTCWTQKHIEVWFRCRFLFLFLGLFQVQKAKSFPGCTRYTPPLWCGNTSEILFARIGVPGWLFVQEFGPIKMHLS